MNASLGRRLLLVASGVMAAFFGMTGLVLERAYVESAEATLRERLRVHAYTLVAAAEPTADGAMRIAHPVSEVRFFLPDSGLYARIVRNDGLHEWTSPSMEGMTIPFPIGVVPTERRFDFLQLADGTEVGALSVGVAWQERPPFSQVFTVSVAEELSEFNAQVAGIRRTLWGWLGVLALVLLALQWGVLRWGLAPLRRVAADLVAIERGARSRLDGDYPAELQGLTSNLNALVESERERRERYRRALGDLAHSLKTPLAILRGAAEGREDLAGFRGTVEGQVARMSDIVDHQLRRAATAGRGALVEAIAPGPIAHKVVEALDRAYAGKKVVCTTGIDPDAVFHGDEDDLMEVFGNLLDNAYKWCRSHVVMTVVRGPRDGLRIVVTDDGPGVDESIASHLFQRGMREPERGGHGIGLAMVRDIVEVYGGRVEITRGANGGAQVVVEF